MTNHAFQVRQWRSAEPLNLSSNSFAPGLSHLFLYIATKGGVVGFTRGLADDLGMHGITVNALAPGLTKAANVVARGVGSNGRSREEEFAQAAEAQAIRVCQVQIEPDRL
ncbi:SDR family NAD(P)-dependent oxidoreductase [Martelella soudanensis]|uniref:SDR family NAD(P)-dependent oxidoreductase n=1 Tax=Martelella sp. NC18 TaxID=2740297 RepID=UPI00211332D8|nr:MULTISPECIES: SDR family NAD(P)-dependent oxidoreductase [unclassified Martelella]